MAYSSNQKSTGLDTLDDTTLAVGDLTIVGDISDSGRAKGITWTSIKAFLKTYFDTLYQPIASTATKATTFTFNGSGGSSGSITLNMQKIGNWVTMVVPVVLATTGTGSDSLTSNTAIDAAYRPTGYPNLPVTIIYNNGANINNGNGILTITPGGLLIFTRDASATAFTNSAVAGSNAEMFVTYYVG